MPATKIAVDTNVLDHARLRKGWLRRELASAAGVSVTSVSKLFTSGESGIVVARRLARAVGLELSDLLINSQLVAAGHTEHGGEDDEGAQNF